ncbi:hypothetical protein Pint_35044 [Pistacia integerrima]|uniref:Uncharacterized protein n=1 Tax=Pistacia integerrima TaxID=434235 RepID=A0ACC0Y2N0_9ROSI|nr:hypothetical protein Pint_35044 [Pistacia integerrima]
MKFSSIIKKILGGGSLSKKSKDYRRLVMGDEKDHHHNQSVKVRRGYVAIYVGEEAKRYEVPVKYLSFPPFLELVKQSVGDDFDTQIDGPINLTCTTETFDELLKLAKNF